MAESYISELGDSLSHGVANTNGDRVKIIAPKLYNDGNGNHPSIATALSGKVDVNNVNLDSQTTTILAQVQSLASSQIHYKRFYTLSDGGSANISDKPTGTTNAGFMLEAYCNRYVGASDWRYVVLCYVTTGRPKITWVTQSTTSISWQDLNTNTDTNVTQTADNSSTGTGFEVLFSATGDNTTRTEGSRKSNKLTFQPSTGTLTATKFSGPLTGNVTGTATAATNAEYVRLQHTNEINFKNVPTSGNKERVWFNYRNGDTDAADSSNLITDYYFGNRNNNITGVRVRAETFIGNLTGNCSGSSGSCTGNAATASAAQSGSALETAINGKPNIYKWNAVTQGQKWSRIFYSESTAGVIGSSGILWIGCTRASVVCNAVFLVTAAHNGAERSNIVELSSCGYSELRCRLVVNSSANYYFEVYDTANSIASGTTQQWYCRYIPLRESNITTYTAFTDGTTIPSNYATCNDFTITVGNSAFAIKNITRSGTTFTATRQNGSTFTFTQQDSDTKNTAGATDTPGKIFLIGATSQTTNPQTYSQDTTYVDTDATLASTKVRVAETCTLQFNTTTNALDFVFA